MTWTWPADPQSSKIGSIELPRKTDGIHRDRVQPTVGGVYYVLPPYGYLEEIELRFERDLPNMDASNPYRLVVELLGPHGETIRPEVTVICRSVEDRNG